MDEFPGLSACRAWVLRERLPDHWARIDPDQRDRALAFWIRASETDEWTFEQLRDLVGAAMDAGESAPALDQWAREVTARRRRKADPHGAEIRSAVGLSSHGCRRNQEAGIWRDGPCCSPNCSGRTQRKEPTIQQSAKGA